MGRKPPSSRKQKPRQELAEDIIAAHLTVAGTVESGSPVPPSFTPEGYTPLTEAVTSIEGGWSKLRQHLHAGRVQSFIWTEQGQLVPVPAEDWGSLKNNDAGQTGRATKLNRAIIGGRDLEGFALVKTSDLKAIMAASRQAIIPGTPPQQKRKGRPLGQAVASPQETPKLASQSNQKRRRGGAKPGSYYPKLVKFMTLLHEKEFQIFENGTNAELRELVRKRFRNDGVVGYPQSRSELDRAIANAKREVIDSADRI